MYEKESTFLKKCAIFGQPVLGITMQLCEGAGVNSRGFHRWVLWVMAAIVLGSGCSGVLFESKGSSGSSESLRIDSGEGWTNYDTHPRYQYDKKNSIDEMSIMLKSVKTF
jgi:hypothetical protein